MSLVPSTDIEEEIVSMQAEHNFSFGSQDPEPEIFYPRPKSHLEYVAARKKQQNHKFKIISTVQRIAGSKPLGKQLNTEDSNFTENIEIETVKMMRYLSFGPSIEEPLDEECKIETHPISDKMLGKKRIPILSNSHFKLRPRIISNAEEERAMGSSRSSTSTPTTEGFNNASESFSSSNNNGSSNAGGITPQKTQQQKSWRHFNNSNTFYTNSSDDSYNNFETANGEGSFYTASNTSKKYLPTSTWHQSRNHNNDRNINTFYNRNSSDDINASSNIASELSSCMKKQQQRKEEKQRPRFYSTMELYEKNLYN